MAIPSLQRAAVDAEVLTLEEIAAYLRLSRKTVYRMVRSGELPAFKAANQWRVRRADLEAWIRGRTHGGRRL